MSAAFSSSVPAAGLAIGRLLLAALFLLEGWSKLRGYDAAVAYMNRFGVSGALLPAVIALELGGGLMIAVGWQTRLAAAALAAFCILTAVIFHGNVADRSQILHFEKDLAIAGGFLVLAVAGAGRWSVDHAAGR
ncbi:DoxX family protein [Hyphomicrobium sp. CS1BSMeth3]|uniref:DoxX family protein n=1 Tax=Hyphomicrobium sp. CS1BSMeth3 TaxID=1892844 RepID=UPI00092FEB08|nr:DoxX family protein [Hyphomicrobium sp. CS1BSMeth3]